MAEISFDCSNFFIFCEVALNNAGLNDVGLLYIFYPFNYGECSEEMFGLNPVFFFAIVLRVSKTLEGLRYCGTKTTFKLSKKLTPF